MVDIKKCKMTFYPSQVLAESSKPVEKIDDEIRKLVERMIDLMIEKKGVGFAAPQAGVPLRLFIISLDGTRENVKVFINPTVTVSGEILTNEEGCLSVPGVYTKIRRYKNATVTATGLDGKEFTEQADGLYARALQHEYDHIEGTTIVNRMSQVAKIAHRKKLKNLIEEQNTPSD
jgi:peptide deformylase